MLALGLYELIRIRIKQHGDIFKIDELCLDEINLIQIVPEASHMLSKCLRLEHITLNDCGLRTLRNIPVLPCLVNLQLSGNLLRDSDIPMIAQYTRLTFLSLDQNQIEKMNWANSLSHLNLTQLRLANNPLTRDPSYVPVCYETFRSLFVVDGIDRNGNEIASESSSEQSHIENSDGSEGHSSIEEDLEEGSPRKRSLSGKLHPQV